MWDSGNIYKSEVRHWYVEIILCVETLTVFDIDRMVVVPCSTVDTCNIWETEQLRSERVHRIVDHRTAIDTDIDVK